MATTPCPPRDQLLRLLEEGLSAAEAETLTAHADACATCQGVLEELTAGAGAFRAELRRAPEQAPPAPDLPARQQGWPEVPGYEVLGVLGRGGEGVVYRARHRALGRLVALKLVRAGAGAEQSQRFRQEAGLLARLSHPNIVQVYEVGEREGVPFFALEYVAGGSLAGRLGGQPLPAALAASLVEAVARAVHAAHRAGVVHRDLKPANILLQPAEGGQRPEEYDGAALPSPEAALRALHEATPKVSDFGLGKAVQVGDELTGTGAVLGTPAYMAPEQAQGRGRRAGPACDVYSLGATLYQLLTGRPPFVGEGAMEVLLQAVHAEPLPPRRLHPGVPRDLETVCLKCLEKDPRRRYASAEALADDLGRFRRGEPVAARRTGVLGRGLKWARRRPAGAALAVACALLLALAGGGGAWYLGARAATGRDVAAALREAKTLGEEARGLSGSPDQWQLTLARALSAAKRAEGLADSGAASNELHAEVRQVLAELGEAERDRLLLAELEAIRLEQAEVRDGSFDRASSAPRYAAAFRDRGLGVLALAPADAAEQLRAHPHREALRPALEDWADVAPDEVERRRLLQILKAFDPDPGSFGNRWRAARDGKDRAALAELAAEAEGLDLPTMPLVALARDLGRSRASARAVRLLEEARWRHPEDFWLNFELAFASQHLEPPRPDQGVRYFSVALGRRPRNPIVLSNLGSSLRDNGELDEAARYCRRAVELDPELAAGHANLGNALLDQDRLAEALCCYRRALDLAPNSAAAHTNLGNALREHGHLDDALRCCRKALELDPRAPQAHGNLSIVLLARGEVDEAIRYCRQAIKLDRWSARMHTNLGTALQARGELDEAIQEHRKAIALRPEAAIYTNLGNALNAKGDRTGAIAAHRQANALKPDYALAHTNLGNALKAKGDLAGAIAAHRRAIALKPNYAEAHNNLGTALRDRGDLAGARAAYRQAIALNPDLPEAYYNLGMLIQSQGDLPGAIAAFRRSIALRPKSAPAYTELGTALRATGDPEGAVAAHRQAIALQPGYAVAHNNLGVVLLAQGKHAGAGAAFAEAVRLKPKFTAYFNLGLALEFQGKLDAAVAAYRQAIRLNPDFLAAHINLGIALQSQGRYGEAEAGYRETLRQRPDHPETHCDLGQALVGQGRFAEALKSLRRGHELGSQRPGWPYPSDRWVRRCERLLELDGRLPALLKGDASPAGARECLEFAQLCGRYRRLPATAARLYAEAFTAEPTLAADLGRRARYAAACAAARAVAGRGEDAGNLPEPAALLLRRQALTWLRADLAGHAKTARPSDAGARRAAQKRLEHWQQDPDLAPLRDKEALARLPAEEREACQKLWADVEALVKTARGKE